MYMNCKKATKNAHFIGEMGMLFLTISAAILFLFGTITGHIIGKSGGDGCRFLGLVGMVGDILFVMRQAQTVDVAGKRAEASLERQ